MERNAGENLPSKIASSWLSCLASFSECWISTAVFSLVVESILLKNNQPTNSAVMFTRPVMYRSLIVPEFI